MSHFAEITGSNNTVIRIIVADQDFIDSGVVGTGSKWIKTLKGTKGGIHYGLDATGSYVPDGVTQLRKNYAGVGYTYNTSSDAFIAPQPEPSASIPYVLNEDSFLWVLSVSES